MDFNGRDLIAIRDFTRSEVERVFEVAKLMEPLTRTGSNMLEGKLLGNIFFEPSTRTRLSFEAAILKLGGGCVNITEPRTSSVAKGESLSDTIKVVENYVNVIALRHPLEGAARLAAEIASIPVINAGSGSGEHPTQALLDLYTITQEVGRIDGLSIGIVGDLRYGRTTHSLAYALSFFKTKLYLVAPESLRMRREVLEHVGNKVSIMETSELEAVIPKVDVLYVTRIQRERFPDPEEYEKVKGTYRISSSSLRKAKKNSIVIHPLPRVDEIAPEVDKSPNAKYFKAVWYGLVTRMAILSLILGVID